MINNRNFLLLLEMIIRINGLSSAFKTQHIKRCEKNINIIINK